MSNPDKKSQSPKSCRSPRYPRPFHSAYEARTAISALWCWLMTMQSFSLGRLFLSNYPALLSLKHTACEYDQRGRCTISCPSMRIRMSTPMLWFHGQPEQLGLVLTRNCLPLGVKSTDATPLPGSRERPRSKTGP